MKQQIKEILNDLENKRKVLIKKHKNHYVDLDYNSWNDVIDGLDYSIHRLRELLRTK